jgi:hypothetical protein
MTQFEAENLTNEPCNEWPGHCARLLMKSLLSYPGANIDSAPYLVVTMQQRHNTAIIYS